jgi:hypothetical protein
MTVKELYEYCKEHNIEDTAIRVYLKDSQMYCDIGKRNLDIESKPINILVLA